MFVLVYVLLSQGLFCHVATNLKGLYYNMSQKQWLQTKYIDLWARSHKTKSSGSGNQSLCASHSEHVQSAREQGLKLNVYHKGLTHAQKLYYIPCVNKRALEPLKER